LASRCAGCPANSEIPAQFRSVGPTAVRHSVQLVRLFLDFLIGHLVDRDARRLGVAIDLVRALNEIETGQQWRVAIRVSLFFLNSRTIALAKSLMCSR